MTEILKIFFEQGQISLFCEQRQEMATNADVGNWPEISRIEASLVKGRNDPNGAGGDTVFPKGPVAKGAISAVNGAWAAVR